MVDILKSIGHGTLIGIANIIPGVSGGTMALMLGIYERLINAISAINLIFLQDFLEALRKGLSEVIALLMKRDIFFLATIGVGAVLAIALSSKLITHLITTWHDPTYGFFAGLVLVSIVVPYGMLKKKVEVKGIITCLVAAGLTIGMTLSVSGEEKLENAKTKHEISLAKAESTKSEIKQSYIGDHSPRNLLFLFLAGAVAISAMILPGISGAFILLLLGVYFEILAAVSARDLTIVATVGCGCIIGLLFFSRFVKYVLQNFHDVTIMALVGLMIGSMYGLWPFQAFEFVGSKRIDLGPVLPAMDLNFLLTAVAFIAASALVLALARPKER